MHTHTHISFKKIEVLEIKWCLISGNSPLGCAEWETARKEESHRVFLDEIVVFISYLSA